MEIRDIESIIEGILFASGEPVGIGRIATCLGIDETIVSDAAVKLRDRYVFERRGIRLVFLDKAIQLCSAPEYADYIRLTLETRKQPQLSQQALEVLGIIAYFQPVTKLYVEQVRGVDSSYTVGLLQERGLIETCGRLAVPGRPLLFRTTPSFLRTFGITSLDELPELPDGENSVSPENLMISGFQALGASEPKGVSEAQP
ncbi:segregation and condensation protein B [Sporobacter termitidis DSM 10068]|uniref:Segregation and condensation protein B n=1 Tax=Sporobacter termitidis DSM 10068 TaxID=1123282 RepID=A0A1M5TJJ6_9FIRM|nr:SMC-Scp complex subunit ScpB [Sporobacter termitidis]SHH50975.1 segregation and condensation protein B [Sporobacter termitidis DSM 10068]